MVGWLTIPVHIDALFLNAETTVVSATGSFDRLPYTDGQQDRNPDIANISEEIVSHAFQDQNMRLKPGVHLHWALPDVLQQTLGGRIVDKTAFLQAFGGNETLWNHLLHSGWLKSIGQTHASIMPASQPLDDLNNLSQDQAGAIQAFFDRSPPNDFPPVPNRWLITRHGDNPGVLQQWIVESDYLFAEGDGTQYGSVSIPYPTDPANHKLQPFRYLGRQSPLDHWSTDSTAERLRPLTATGYGTPTFAAFYPNCHSVFGLHDPGPAYTDIPGLSYDLVGWYSDGEADFLATYIMDFKNRFPLHNDGAQPQLSDVLDILREDAGWAVASASAELTRSVFFARIQISGAPVTMATPANPKDVSISVGHTGTEALAAYLAHEIDPANKEMLEDQIEAIQMASQFENRRLDIGLKFQEARHTRAYNAQPGGQLWVIRPESQADQPADAGKAPPAQITLDQDFAHKLNQANICQVAYERAQAEIAFLRHITFTDWYKYMLAAYPPEDSRDAYPDIDEVKTFIEKEDIARLERLQNASGSITLLRDGDKIIGVSSFDSAPGSLAEKLAEAVETMLSGIRQHNEQIDTDTAAALAAGNSPPPEPRLLLTQSPAPRFWQPNEPVVLLVGDTVRPTPRYGRDTLDCIVFEYDDFAVTTPDAASALRQRVLDAMGQTGWSEQQWTGPDWHPLLLEWEVEVFPLRERGNLNVPESNYDPRFITANFELQDEACTLSIRPGMARTIKGSNLYSGQSILTPQPGVTLKSMVDAFLRKNIVATYNADAPADKKIVVSGYPPDDPPITGDQIGWLQSWYENKNLQGIDASQRARDALYTAIRAYAKLLDVRCLSQSLSGFNDALLMHKQTFQLLLADPLGFEAYRTFTEDVVRQAVGAHNHVAPVPYNDFNPIRSGAMNILQLRLVDSFGRVSANLGLGDIITVDHMTNPDSLYPVFLKPSFVQPARLNFRLLSASLDDVEMNTHPASSPICGWVLPNYLDNSLMCYDADGTALGSIQAIVEWNDTAARWEPAPGGGLAEPEMIANSHFRNMVARLRRLTPDFVKAFLSALASALDNIDPENFAHHEGLALLVGRPLALVRATINAELKTPPAIHHGWYTLLQDMQHTYRETNQFTGVDFPIRLGEYRQLNDGLAGYWVENVEEPDIFYSPQDDDVDHEYIRSRAGGPLHLKHSFDAPPITVSMLVDPRGSIHATTGVLPPKHIALPPDQYAEALKRIQVTFFSTPILGQTDQLAISLPDEPGYVWSWIEHNGDGWVETDPRDIAKVNTQATFAGQQILRDGWLKLSKEKTDGDQPPISISPINNQREA